MIPKKSVSNNPSDYRPISLTSCIGKVIERLIASRLCSFLEKKNILIKQQSGFRKSRRASDNLVGLSQIIGETLNRGKKVCAIMFDIAKAFDTVWHNGLIYKLMGNKTPTYLINWIENFLKNRQFRVCVNGSMSENYPISAGVPQGAAISPILFSVYINDIPICEEKNYSGSFLFADDLSTFFIFDKASNVKRKIYNYMLAVEAWLNKWRLLAAPKKCSYTIFSANGKSKEKN